jgi:hypothetical protein
MNIFLKTYFSNWKWVRKYIGGTWEYWTTEKPYDWAWYKLDNPSNGAPYPGLIELKGLENYD